MEHKYLTTIKHALLLASHTQKNPIYEELLQKMDGFVFVPREISDDLNDQLWDFMTDNFIHTNEDGDAFIECADFNLNMFYKAMIEAQGQIDISKFDSYVAIQSRSKNPTHD